MYGLSISRPEKIPPLLLKLSDLLRYSVYDVKEAYVPLKNEMAYILNYIDFEKIRIGEKLILNTSFEHVADDRIKIAPMLLIVFVENAFKHSKNTAEKKIYIDISLKTWADSIVFSITNNHCQMKVEPGLIRKDGGLGLVNVRKRLDLLYAHAYDLDIQSGENTFSVMLQLKVK
jgi:sensor histidine kinase YesM